MQIFEVVMNKIYVILKQKIMLNFKQGQKIEVLFTYLNKFIERDDVPKTQIGFRTKSYI